MRFAKTPRGTIRHIVLPMLCATLTFAAPHVSRSQSQSTDAQSQHPALTAKSISQNYKRAASAVERQAALLQLQSLMKSGSHGAKLALAEIYSGQHGEEDIDGVAAVGLFNELVVSGDAYAALQLSNIYFTGLLVPKDDAKGLTYLRMSAQLGSIAAKRKLGERLLKLPEHLDIALATLKDAAAEDDIASIILLGETYSRGTFLKEDGVLAISYYKKAALLGDAYSGFRLGEIYSEGLIVHPDSGEAIKYLTFASDAGLNSAKIKLAEFHIKGVGVKADPLKGAAMLRAIIENENDAATLIALGDLLSTGDYLPKDAEAVEFYRRAAELDNSWAWYRLGQIYSIGTFGEKDATFAKKCFEEAFKLGLPAAQLAMLHLEAGQSTYEHDQWIPSLLQLAETGNLSAALALADSYYWGMKVQSNPEKALELLDQLSAAGAYQATSKLISLHRDAPGAKIRRSLARASLILETRANQFNSRQLRKEEILLSAARATTREQFDAVVSDVLNAPPSIRVDIIADLRVTNPNLYVYFAQRRMQDSGLYKGRLDGRLTKATIIALNRLCETHSQGEVCKAGPLTYPAARIIAVRSTQLGS